MKQSTISNTIDPPLIGQTGSGAVAVQDSVAAGAGGVAVKGNVAGSIQVTNKQMEVHADHGAVININDAPPHVKKRDATPQPTRPVRGFVSRVDELKRLDQMITANEAVLICGMDGIGKSALLKQSANREAARTMPDGVVFLEGIDERGERLGPEDVIQRLFDKLFESEPRLKVNFDIAQTYLSNTKPLVILNGLNLPAASVSRMADLFPLSAVLIESSRLSEGDTAEGVKLGPLPRNESIALLVAKAGMTLDDAAPTTVDAVCALLADVPLAIVTAAHAIRENHLTLERAYDILVSIKPLSMDALRSGIERAYALAYSTLTELEREFLAAAALAPGISIDPHWLHHMLDNQPSVEQAQERLQAMGLLTANSPRLRIDSGFRDLAHIGTDETQIKEKLISYLKTMLETQSLDWNYCADELGNILGMIAWATKQQRWEDVITLGRAIDPYLTLHGLWEAWHGMIDDVRQAARQLDDRANEAWALHQLGTHAIGIEQPSQAIDFLRQAFDLRNALGDAVGMAYTKHNLDPLIPPSPNGSHDPPAKPKGKPPILGSSLNLLWKTIIIGTVIMLGGYVLIAKAHNQPFVPVTGGAMPTIVNTKTAMVTLTAVVTHTVTLTITSSTPTETPTLISIIATTPSPAHLLTLTGLQNANCRIGPSTAYDPPYGTLLKGRTVDILGVNAEGTWFLVKHPQSFRYPCWIWNGPAVRLNGDFIVLHIVAVPPAIKLRTAASQVPSSQSLSTSPEPPGQVNVCILYPGLCSNWGQLFPTATTVVPK